MGQIFYLITAIQGSIIAMKEKFQDFIAPLGVKNIPFGAFYNFPHALRFELGIGENRIRRMVSAFDRARAICNHILEMQIDEIYAVFRIIDEKRRSFNKQRFFETMLDYLNIKADNFINFGIAEMPDGFNNDDDSLCCYWYAVKLKSLEDIDGFLWFPVSAEMGFKPILLADLYIYDRKNAILIHPYDDRGMDVIAAQKQSLVRLYQDFNGWLLDYDRTKMDENFASFND